MVFDYRRPQFYGLASLSRRHITQFDATTGSGDLERNKMGPWFALADADFIPGT